MNVHDWALVIFTILAQMSVGSFVALGIVYSYANRKAGPNEADLMCDLALWPIGGILILGMLASLLHLGNPLNAYRAVFNIGSSWLSMEIASGVLFAAFGALFTLMQWRKIGSFAVRNVVAWIAALIGLWLVYSMSQVYMLRTVPTWDVWTTPVTFFTTTLLLGVLAIGTVFAANYTLLQRRNSAHTDVQAGLLRNTLRGVSVAAVLLLGIEFVIIPMHYAVLAAGSPVTVAAVSDLMSESGLLLGLRLALVFIGAGFLAVFGYRYTFRPGHEGGLGVLVYVAFALVLVAEVLGRVLFYASYANIGL
ncbi:MAG: dimethyl sulfoxide reductase anchor subunit [Caldilineaceae bacterium]|nr:dimethyl sulfoxide reductase anchor subunit [Caldilineaceae bacterium]